MKTGYFALAMLLAFGVGAMGSRAQEGSPSAGQNGAQAAQTDSLAAAARQARADRKDQPKAAKVFTNDNLPTNATISYVGSSANTPTTNDTGASSNQAANANTKAGAKVGGSGDKSSDEAALAKAKQQLESAKKDLDIDQRKFALDQQDYLSNPNHNSDTETAATLQTEQDGISAKKDEVEAAEKVVDDLKARLDTDSEAASAAPAPASAPAAASDDSNSTSAPPAGPAPTSDSPDNAAGHRL